jgi:dihydroorotate dehydrogenase
MDPEKAHELTISLLSRFPGILSKAVGQDIDSTKYQISLGDLKWSFPVGLAAGLDKNAEAIDFFSRTLFGAVEVGTVTPKAQPGNPKPRMFRYVEEESLRNRMGFNNLGADRVYKNICDQIPTSKVLGINLGKNKITSEEEAFKDYVTLYNKFSPVGDYLVINVSSPNTPGLRDLQSTDKLKVIFEALEGERKKNSVPLYLKISPDQSFDDVGPIIELAQTFNLAGIIATNTTIMESRGTGGISGKLCSEKSKAMRRFVLERASGNRNFEVIGVGGISDFSDLFEFWKLGGKAVQIYTSFIFKGPDILDYFKDEIDKALLKNKVQTLNELLENIDQAE